MRDLKTGDPAEDAEDSDEGEREKSAGPEEGEESGEPGEAAQGASEAVDDSPAPDGAQGPQKGADASGSGDERPRAAVAQWVTSADEKAAREPGEPGESEKAGDAAAKASAGTEGTAQAKAGEDSGAEGAGDGGTGPVDAPGTEPEGETEPSSKPAPKWAVDSDEDADREDGRQADREDNREDDAPESDKPSPEDAKGDKDDKDDKDAEAAPAAEPRSDSPVDQPTAVFKAVRPAKPAVDQPTTMLKLGGAAKAASPATDDKGDKADTDAKADDKADKGSTADAKDDKDAGKPTSEGEAERTSKFVALKPLDDPATRKPKPSEPARPAGPAAAPAEATAVVPQIGPERTTQQPLPPKPPLDLLAELTNTPPPPPTPLRTLARRVKIWTPLVILMVIVFAIVQAVRPLPATALTLTAKDSYTFEGGKLSLPWPEEGQGAMDVNGIGTMDRFGEQKPVAIGSVAKAMTAYVVLKDHALKSGEEGPSVPVDATAEKEGGYDQQGESTLNTVKAGDKLTLRQALSAIMIPSANNIARLLARWDAGTEAEFIKKMNDAAEDLGMKNTTYTDASGLKETTVSTAEDQVKLGNELVKIPALVEITKLPEWTDPSGQKWRNYNTLVPYNNAIGIKTGSTTKAGGNLLFAATKEVGGETVTVVGAILGQHKSPIIDTVNAVSKIALLAAQDGLVSEKILKRGDVVGYVDDKMGHHTPVVVTKDVTAVGWAGLTTKLSFASGEVPHTAKAGTQVGTLTVGDGSGGAVEVPVALQEDLVEPGLSDKLTRIG
ncbi:D-alanyl-D-alanine carboxypeptidase [Streptomyces sp. NPDC051315]|uniref:D-alanyl-D-alanine carboxypeptidase n=1 Tax=Streptomyces sp. NPDC051315 TaxID=3365650 RepID=UPI00379E7FAC